MSFFSASTKKHTLKSISFAFFFSFLALSTLILLIEGSISIYTSYQSEQKFVFYKQQYIAKEAGVAVQDYIHEKFLLLDSTAGSNEIGKKSREEQQIILNKTLLKDPALRQLVIYSINKQERVRASRLSSVSINEIDHYIDNHVLGDVRKGMTHISDTYIDQDTNEPLILLVVPIKNVFGDSTDLLVAEVNLKLMWDLVGNIKVGKRGVAYVVDEKGNLLAYKDTSRVLKGENLNSLHEVKEFLKGEKEYQNKESHVTRGINGTDVVSTFYAFSAEPYWAVIIEEPVEDVYHPIYEEIIRLALLMVVGFILAILVSILLARKITQPIVQLRNAAQRISSGDLNATIEITSNNEIGELAETLKQMTEQLKESNGVLEQKVKDKTAELEAKMSEYEKVSKLMLGRELRMIELKRENEKLKQELKKNTSET